MNIKSLRSTNVTLQKTFFTVHICLDGAFKIPLNKSNTSRED